MRVGSLIETTNEYILAEMAIDAYIDGDHSLLEAYSQGETEDLLKRLRAHYPDYDPSTEGLLKRLKAHSNGKPIVSETNTDDWDDPFSEYGKAELVKAPEGYNPDSQKQAYENLERPSRRSKSKGIYNIRKSTMKGTKKRIGNPIVKDGTKDDSPLFWGPNAKVNDEVYDDEPVTNSSKEQEKVKDEVSKIEKKSNKAPKNVLVRMVTALRNLYKKWLGKQNMAKARGENIGPIKSLLAFILNAIDRLMKRIRIAAS